VSSQAVDRMGRANQGNYHTVISETNHLIFKYKISDMEEWSKELGSLPPLPVVGDCSPTSWGPLLGIQHNLQLGFSTLSTQYSEDQKDLINASLETAKIVQVFDFNNF
jgi:hypothetical protein